MILPPCQVKQNKVLLLKMVSISPLGNPLSVNINFVGLKNIRQLETCQQETLPKLLDSPNFRMAMINLGISREDLSKKQLDEFDDPTLEQEVVQVRFKFYQTRMMHTLNKLLEERHRLKNQPLLSLIESSHNGQQAAAKYIQQKAKLPQFLVGAQNATESLQELITSPKLKQPFRSRAGSLSKRETMLPGIHTLSPSPQLYQTGADSSTLPMLSPQRNLRVSFNHTKPPSPKHHHHHDSHNNDSSFFLLTQLAGEANVQAERAERLKQRRVEMAVRQLEQEAELKKCLEQQI